MDDNNEIRQLWTPSQTVQIFSNSKQKWFDGEIASVFHDEEGEWLEIRYDKSMSKQVQRYSSDIRPCSEDLKKLKLNKSKIKKVPNADGFPFPEPEMKDRTSWSKGFEVEIFSNTHQEWYLGEIVDIIKDDEGEWLNVVWARANGEAMSKQVQRFSTDVRPAQNANKSKSDSDDDENEPNSKNMNISVQLEVDRKTKLSVKIQKRKENFRRRAPPFSRTLKPSTFQYPATASVRRLRKLINIEEKVENNDQLLFDNTSTPKKLETKIEKKKVLLKISTWKAKQVQQFIRGFGKEYVKHLIKFRGMNGKKFISITETDLQKMKIPKLHSMKILLSIAKNSSAKKHAFIREIHSGQVLNWTPMDVNQWMSSQQTIVAQYRQKFNDHGIDGLLLFDLDDEDLILMGVAKKTHRTRIKKVISAFKIMCFAENAKNEQKEEEDSNNNKNGTTLKLKNMEERSKHMRRKSVQILNIEELNGNSSGRMRDELIVSMAQLMIEVGKVINAGSIPSLTLQLQQKLDICMQSMIKDGRDDSNSNSNSIGSESESSVTIIDRAEQVISRVKAANTENEMSAIGLGSGTTDAWLKSQSNEYIGHKRRGSLPYLNPNLLADIVDEEEDEDDSVSDLD